MAERVPAAARALISEGRPRISPLVALELAYLQEVGRARDPVAMMLVALRRDAGIEVADISLAELTQAATDLSWTRDPFDRLIAAHAIVANAPLVTADRTIREHLPLATWD
jgi:PIN domain nuclease of toxin-antitoxin system